MNLMNQTLSSFQYKTDLIHSLAVRILPCQKLNVSQILKTLEERTVQNLSFRETNMALDENEDIGRNACFRTNAQSRVINLRQSKAYYRFMRVDFIPQQRNSRFRIENCLQPSLLSMTIRFPLSKSLVLSERIDIVQF